MMVDPIFDPGGNVYPRKPAKMLNRAAAYKRGVDWLALNDEPGMDDVDMFGQTSVIILAVVFGIDVETVIRDVLAVRRENDLI